MTLPLIYRASRRSVWPNSAQRVSLAALPIRSASLSAIHQGFLKSDENARPQVAGSSEGKRLTYAERKKLREELAKQRPTYKIRKGKKDITEYPDEAKPQSRKARFYDPSSSFGKKSFVYQMKQGLLDDQLKELQEEIQRKKRSAVSAFKPKSASQPAVGSASRSRGARRSARSARDAGRRQRDVEDDRPMSDAQFRTALGSDEPQRPTRTVSRRLGSSRRAAVPDSGREAQSRHRKRLEPLSIPYTTAASQFLYGKSTVEAALRSSRRKLHKLYIYDGPNRRITSDNALIHSLAKRKDIPVTILKDDTGLRLMDKMAASRPHNGFVLEASALPQPPLSALGPLADDYSSNPGFAITLGHQSAEEAAVNGTRTFVPAPSKTHKPLVVILDQILDPGNLGAILRTVSFLGATAVGITRHGTATLTPVALKASAGAAEALDLFSISSLPEFLNASRQNGWAVYAAVANGPRGSAARQRRHMDLQDVEEADPLMKEPCVLLIGNEGEGLSRLVVKKADYEVNIPNLSGSSAVDSLNVSVATGLLCSAFLRGMGRQRYRIEAVDGIAADGEREVEGAGSLW
ncbi:rRNA methyltransferase 1, mitochondrial [Madurella mycetomatis]|uniref:rRNA methyltransferase 1, mitochondrial n=1 Tax=Madurella mycetomatis TaxID=100816 RepID=A0A175WE81_9PEZI|nr:rRNA methyltransferase 1, mitochondrial [Madurella mycetomatis]